MTDKRSYDVIVFGATGFTGVLVAEYLARQTGEQVRWAIAGRNPDKLGELKASLVRLNPACEQVGIIKADNRDWGSLVFMAQQAKVVVTTVGPYADQGDKVVHACVTAGAD